MRRILTEMIVLCAMSAFFSFSCGENQAERGVPDTVDEATPIDPAQLDMTEEERRKQDDV